MIEAIKRYGIRTVIFMIIIMVVTIYFRMGDGKPRGTLDIISINEHNSHLTEKLSDIAFPNSEFEEANTTKNQTIISLEFMGDSSASNSKYLAADINTILSRKEDISEVIVSIESSGGAFHEYGYASSQLKRLKNAGISLTTCIDKVAASGGYMMASTADRIVAAPFAVVGSIGVVVEIPNFNQLLKNHGVEFNVLTAGENKRTMTMLGENTEKGKEKLRQDLENVHELFKKFVVGNRAKIDIAKVANGDIWYGEEALSVGLVDEISTCDDYIIGKTKVANVFKFQRKGVKSTSQSISAALTEGISNGIKAVFEILIYKDYYR